MLKTGSFALMKNLNKQIIFELIYKKGPISRAKIAEITGLSPATVTNITRELIKKGFVLETARGASRGGRKPVMLDLNPKGAYVIGLEWGITEIRGVLLNINQKIIEKIELTVNSHQAEDYIKNTLNIIKLFLDKMVSKEKLFGIGIGVHGLVDAKKGISLFTPHFHWQTVPIKAKLEKEINYPIYIDNDVRMMALAEKWQGRDNFIFINTGVGIGAAIVLKGDLYSGLDWTAGEAGHMKIVEEGPTCSCGNQGCLEAMISVTNLVNKYQDKKNQVIPYPTLQSTWYKMLEQARKGDKKALDILKQAAKYLGIGIANLVNLLNPQVIIIGGLFVEAQDLIFPLLRKEVKNKALEIPGARLKIAASSFTKEVGAVGAGTRALKEFIKFK